MGKCRKEIHDRGASVSPAVFIVVDENWIEFTLRYAADYKERRTVKSNLYEKILTAFKMNDTIDIIISQVATNINIML